MPDPGLSPQPQALTTARLRLEPLGPQHARGLFGPLRDAELYRFIPQDPPPDEAALEARYRRVAAGPASALERWWNWAVSLRDEPGAPLGTVEVTLLEGGRRALLAYMFGRAAWGRGLAYEACRAACGYLATFAAIRDVEAHIDTRNARSIALVLRLGFVCDGRVENSDYFKGSPSDEVHYRLALAKDDDGETLRR